MAVRDEVNPFLHIVSKPVSLQQCACHFHHRDLTVHPDIVYLSDLSTEQNDSVRLGGVLHEHVASLGSAFAMDTQLLLSLKPVDELRDELFRVLTRPIDVVTSCNDGWQSKRMHIRSNHHFCCCLARSIWICGQKHALRLFKSVSDQVVSLCSLLDSRGARAAHPCDFIDDFILTVHLIGADVYEPLNLMLVRSPALEQSMGAEHVRLGEAQRVAKRVVDVRLCREVEDCVDFEALDDEVQ
mmetsp:Transcript_23939/g.46661  ORF Transcript_23939/g.46661 Transcript_23939/m.46661 type:complete len:241 (+) Transcript_23939:537-1259(+)|eukprot:CAMPEP_0167773394 /NCGR_PEP_ID=MMETSP0111_2-20121227/1392_1 /TAXON_ID=91324 /ORGANISM="Lotharella globosa, Strain CCCM811" /LENGTH=240 /DNA_ID=CAMNT_0007663019 /DNA_START=502 /DNA_END=1224 /DNA_ORIENTATION=+